MPCLIAIGLAAVVLIAAGVQAGTLLAIGAAVACPLMMLLMMGGGIHKIAHRQPGREPSDTSPTGDPATRS